MTAPYRPEPAPRTPLIARWVRGLLGAILLSIAIVLPWRWRVRYADAVGRALNRVYHGYLRLLVWFFRKLEAR